MPSVTARMNLMSSIYYYWCFKKINNLTTPENISKYIQTIETRISTYVYMNQLSDVAYSNMIYRVNTFLVDSKKFARILTEQKLEDVIVMLNTMDLQNMTEMDPDNFEHELLELEARKSDVISAEPTERFTCRSCKKNKTIATIMQTRGSDEPPTAFYTCVFCKTKGRQSL